MDANTFFRHAILVIVIRTLAGSCAGDILVLNDLFLKNDAFILFYYSMRGQ